MRLRMGWRRSVAVGATALALGGAGVVLGGASSGSTPFNPVLLSEPEPSNAADQAAGTLPSAPPATLGLFYISPTTSDLGRASAQALGAQYDVQSVRSRRVEVNGVVLGNESALATGAAGDRYLVTHYDGFRPSEMAQAGFVPQTSADGTYWVTSDQPELQAITFLSSSGVGVRVDHLSASSSDHVDAAKLLTLATSAAARLQPSKPLS